MRSKQRCDRSGAKAYYSLDQPSFLEKYAEVIGLLLSVSILCVSSFWQLRSRREARQKNRADAYNLKVLELVDQVNQIQDVAELEVLRQQLFAILRRVIEDLDYDKISPESFQSFTFPWEVAIATVRHREMLLTTHLPSVSPTASNPQASQVVTSSGKPPNAE